MKTKIVNWWEYSCPECDETNPLDNPPFPRTHTCKGCGKIWDVQKLRSQNYIYQASDRVPA